MTYERGLSSRFSKFGLLCMISLIIYVLENYLQEMFFEGISNIINFVLLYRIRSCEQLKSLSILMQKNNSTNSVWTVHSSPEACSSFRDKKYIIDCLSTDGAGTKVQRLE